MSNTSGTIRDTVRETARDVKEAARESEHVEAEGQR